MAQQIISKRNVQLRHMNGKGKVAQSIPQAVKDAINSVASQSVKSFTLFIVPEDYKVSASEGRRYSKVVNGDYAVSVEIVSNDTVGAYGVSHQINRQIEVSAGDWLVEYYWYYGMIVYHFVPEEHALPDNTESTDEDFDYNPDCPMCLRNREHSAEDHCAALRRSKE